MGVKPYKGYFVHSEPMEYFYPTSQQTFAINSLVKQGSTGGGKLDYADGTTSYTNGLYLTLKATTGSSVELIPVTRVLPEILYSVPLCSSETVVSTTLGGQCISVSSSGGAVASSTGSFKISTVYNTSANTAQYFTGKFLFVAVSTN